MLQLKIEGKEIGAICK